MFQKFEWFIIVSMFLVGVSVTQDFAFEESEEKDPKRQNADHRKPIYVPTKCNENELLFPGDQTDDWVCDCFPGYIFYPTVNRCFPTYRQGPCEAKKYLVLKPNSVLPECIPNPCGIDGQVQVKTRCYELGKSGPCPFPELSNVLGINTTTLEIACVRLSMSIQNRFDENNETNSLYDFTLNQFIPLCPLGSKRHFNGTCHISV